MKFKRCLALVLALMSACLAVGCGGSEDTEDIGNPPDYSDSQLQMEFYGYHSMSSGRYSIDDVTYDVGEDFRTVERFKEYMDCGMNMVFLQNVAYKGEDFETSEAKKYMDMFCEAGATRIIISDQRLYDLSQLETPLVGDDEKLIAENKQFKTQEDLEKYVADCLDDYHDYPAFYGLLMRDEPSYKMFDASAAVYRAIKKYDENIFVKQNLLPLSSGVHEKYAEKHNTQTLQESYVEYLTTWQEKTGADYIMFDSYPILESGILSDHITGLKIVADICKEKDLSLYVVAQTMEMMNKGKAAIRKCSKADMYWQLNMLQGFGVKRIAYFTYWRRSGSKTTGEFFVDNASFISSSGKKTDLYYYMTDIHKEIQNFAPTLLSFDYNTCTYYMKEPMDFAAGYLGGLEREAELACIKGVTVEQSDLLFVTEMTDADNGNYMYMLQNIMDPAKGLVGDTVVHAEVEFDSKYKYVAVYYKGEVTYKKLVDHKYSTELSAGYAEFVIPYV